MGRYDDIIDHPHHVSETHPRMPLSDRAAQFSPFAALTGYDAGVREAARRVDQRVELDEEQKRAIDEALRQAEGKPVEVVHFVPDGRKAGGSYVTTRGVVSRLSALEGSLLVGETWITFDDIYSIELR